MSDTTPTVEHLTKLANLELPTDEQAALAAEFRRIIDFVDALRSAEVGEAQPTSQVTELENVYRADTVEPSVHARTLVETAPHQQGTYFRAPAVFGGQP
ncbi:MAG: Asp-tRNA(Asn)/Glu-tRNA(Gln) amidotransferase subunit GatC [Candidatus Kerfeldbacteria bacterium]|nr:Asp-tRNA(Asn)/Glu-tRNA(Gln) amidotransferase subunit GatC [Candidatus Kerfeldbacteria bacterium]